MIGFIAFVDIVSTKEPKEYYDARNGSQKNSNSKMPKGGFSIGSLLYAYWWLHAHLYVANRCQNRIVVA